MTRVCDDVDDPVDGKLDNVIKAGMKIRKVVDRCYSCLSKRWLKLRQGL